VDEEEYRQIQSQRQLDVLKKQLFMRLLTKEARSRLANIKLANPELAEQLEIALIQALQSGKIAQIDEQTLITLIKRLKGGPQGTSIMRR
jgi:programmed cell death protein 5